MKKEKKQLINEQDLKVYIELITEDTVASMFFDPIASVVKTGMYSVENAIASAKELARGIIAQIPSLLIPGLRFNYEQFMIDWDNKLATVEKKYEKDLKEVFDGLKSRDLWGMMFLLHPELMLGQKLLFAAPETALRAMEVLSGGDQRLTSIRQRYSSATAPLAMPQSPYGWQSGGGGGSYGGGYGGLGGDSGGGGGGGMGESRYKKNKLIEQPDQMQNMIAELQQLLQDPSFTTKLQSSPILLDIKKTGMQTWIEKIKKIDSITSLDDPELAVILGGNQVIDKIKNSINIDINKNKELKDAKEKEAALKLAYQQALTEVKKDYKEFYKKELEQIVAKDPAIQDEAALILKQANIQ